MVIKIFKGLHTGNVLMVLGIMKSGTRSMQTGCAAFCRGLGTDAICFLDHALQHRVHLLYISVLQCIAVYYSVLQCTRQRCACETQVVQPL